MKLNVIFLVCLFFTLGCSAQTKDRGACNPTVINKFLELNELLIHTMADSRITNDCTIAAFARDIKREGNHKEGLEAKGKLERIRAFRVQMTMSLEDIKANIKLNVMGGQDPRTGLLVNPAEETKLELLMIGVGKKGLGWKLQEALKNFTVEVAKIADIDPKELPLLAEDNERNPLYKHDPIQRNKHFVQANFGQTPAAAALVVLTHEQNEILRTESIVMRKIIDDMRNSQRKK